MKADIARVNSEGVDGNVIVGSTDVKALYPSLDITFTIDVVCEFFETSEVVIHGIDYDEVGLYISLNRTIDQIRNLGLEEVCPTRIGKRGTRPTITASGTAYDKEDRFSPWTRPVSVPDQRQQRIMFKEALRIGLEAVMNNHVYRFANCIRHQQKGGPIGLELTGNISQVFMIWWDRTLKLRLNSLGIMAYMYKRYVDDINLAVKETPLRSSIYRWKPYRRRKCDRNGPSYTGRQTHNGRHQKHW